MRTFVGLSLITLLVLISPNAFAGFVGTVNMGASLPSVDTGGDQGNGEAGYNLGHSVGFRFGELVQWDTLEFHYGSADQSSSLGAYAIETLGFGSGVRIGDFSDSSKLHVYGSFGIGVGRNKIEFAADDSASRWSFEWNIGMGFLYDLSELRQWGLRYRYRTYRGALGSSASSFSGENANISVHSFGVEFAFGD